MPTYAYFPSQSLEVYLVCIKDLSSRVEWVTLHITNRSNRSWRVFWVYKIAFHFPGVPILPRFLNDQFHTKGIDWNLKKLTKQNKMTKNTGWLMVAEDFCIRDISCPMDAPWYIVSSYSSEVLWKTTESRWWIRDSKHQSIFLHKTPRCYSHHKGTEQVIGWNLSKWTFWIFTQRMNFMDPCYTLPKNHLFFVFNIFSHGSEQIFR